MNSSLALVLDDYHEVTFHKRDRDFDVEVTLTKDGETIDSYLLDRSAQLQLIKFLLNQLE